MNNLPQLSRLIFEIRSSGASLPPISGKFVPQVHSTLGRNTFTFVNAGKYDARALARIHEITNIKTVLDCVRASAFQPARDKLLSTRFVYARASPRPYAR